MTTSSSREEIKARVKEAADIVQVIGESVQLKKTGGNYSALCPFHADKDPSFSVNPRRQFFHCFGCGESGDVFSFLMKYHQMSFPEALEELARRYQIDLPEKQVSPKERELARQREKIFEINEQAANLYHSYLLADAAAEPARQYLKSRDIPEEIIKKYRLGYCPDPKTSSWSFIFSQLRSKGHGSADIEKAGLAVKKERGGYYDRFRDRVLFPIVDMTGRVVAFGGRILGDGMPKYMNSPETPVFDKSRILFGLHPNREAIRANKKALVVEGNFDLLSLVVHGFSHVVAPLGTALSRKHIRTLKGYCDEVILIFDGDAAGLKAAMRTVPHFLSEHVDARVVVLPEEHDPDTYVREVGVEGFSKLVEGATDLSEFIYTSLTRRYGRGLEGKNKIIDELRPLITASTDPGRRALMRDFFSEKLGLAPQDLAGGMQVRKTRQTRTETEVSSLENLSKTQRQLLNFIILYPEFVDELVRGGAAQVLKGSAAEKIIDCLQELTASRKGVSADLLLEVFPHGVERNYISKLLVEAPIEDEEENSAEMLRDKFLAWLQTVQQRRKSDAIRREIDEAQQNGDHERIMELLQLKQQIAKKLADFSCHLMKEI